MRGLGSIIGKSGVGMTERADRPLSGDLRNSLFAELESVLTYVRKQSDSGHETLVRTSWITFGVVVFDESVQALIAPTTAEVCTNLISFLRSRSRPKKLHLVAPVQSAGPELEPAWELSADGLEGRRG